MNLNLYRGIMAVPWMSLDVYSVAHKEGYRFETLLPAFSKLWHLHRRFKELRNFYPWHLYRIFVICGVVATIFCTVMSRLRILGITFWVFISRCTDYLAWFLFGKKLLVKRRLPMV